MYASTDWPIVGELAFVRWDSAELNAVQCSTADITSRTMSGDRVVYMRES